jgi:hypothetical protein
MTPATSSSLIPRRRLRGMSRNRGTCPRLGFGWVRLDAVVEYTTI